MKYINGEQLDSQFKISGLMGTAFHKGIEEFYFSIQEGRPHEQCIQDALSKSLNFLEEFPNVSVFTEKIPRSKAQEMVSYGLTQYLPQCPIDVDILSVEELHTVEVDTEIFGQKITLPIPLSGRSDFIYRDHQGRIIIRDHKSTQKNKDKDSIDGGKILQGMFYYFITLAKYGEAPYACEFMEVKLIKNKDNSPQVTSYTMIYEESRLYFDFFLRIYWDVVSALAGEQVFPPNLGALYDNELALVSYIYRLDETEEKAKLFKKYQVQNITELLQCKLSERSKVEEILLKIQKQITTSSPITYDTMNTEQKIVAKLMEHGVLLTYDSTVRGNTVDTIQYSPSIGVRMNTLKKFTADIEQVLGLSGVRILAPIPNTNFVGVEIPREERAFPTLPSSTLADLNIHLGVDSLNTPVVMDLAEAPHLLIAGTTGSGKTVFLHSIIKQLIKRPTVELVLVDPKHVEFAHYNANIYNDIDDITEVLMATVEEMEARYKAMKKAKVINAQDINLHKKVIIIDEFADLMTAPKWNKQNIETCVQRIAQLGRAAGIHIIVATQRPSVDVITGRIKANFPTKISFRVGKAIDSHVVLDNEGAEKLMGKGDMLLADIQGLTRLQAYAL